jgi:hypothetical protein
MAIISAFRRHRQLPCDSSADSRHGNRAVRLDDLEVGGLAGALSAAFMASTCVTGMP